MIKDFDKTQVVEMDNIIKEQTEAEYAATHNGCKNFIEVFNTQPHTILFSRFDQRTIESSNLNSICRHIKKAAKIAWYNIPIFDRRKKKRVNI